MEVVNQQEQKEEEPEDRGSSSTAGLKNHHQQKSNHRVLVEGTEFQEVAGFRWMGRWTRVGGGGREGSAACVETQTQAFTEHRAASNAPWCLLAKSELKCL